ncbi:MAG TPA: S-4TM family putative pore-forming effector [Methanoregulaceae archaeon]|nr:S-4TM family putative pore-forming effector [Methanoregulaceae archaeon]
MPNRIPYVQNETLQLQRLAAQRQLYSSAKNVKKIKCILTIPVLSILSIITFFVSDFKIWFAFYGICLVLLNSVLLNPLGNSLQSQAAIIQELFDCEVLHLQWPKWKLTERPDPELIQKESAIYLKKNQDFSALQNWYPIQIGRIPLPLARIICQRVNLKYDADLRRNYITKLLLLFIFVGIFIAALAILGGLNVETFVLVMLTPLLPLIIWGIEEYTKNIHAADHLEKLKSLSEQLWNSSIKSPIPIEQFEMESRDLQNEIFEFRKNNPLVFDWIYTLLKQSQQNQMNESTDFFVSEAINNLISAQIDAYD